MSGETDSAQKNATFYTRSYTELRRKFTAHPMQTTAATAAATNDRRRMVLYGVQVGTKTWHRAIGELWTIGASQLPSRYIGYSLFHRPVRHRAIDFASYLMLRSLRPKTQLCWRPSSRAQAAQSVDSMPPEDQSSFAVFCQSRQLYFFLPRGLYFSYKCDNDSSKFSSFSPFILYIIYYNGYIIIIIIISDKISLSYW